MKQANMSVKTRLHFLIWKNSTVVTSRCVQHTESNGELSVLSIESHYLALSERGNAGDFAKIPNGHSKRIVHIPR